VVKGVGVIEGGAIFAETALGGLKQMIVCLGEAAKRDQQSGRDNKYGGSHRDIPFCTRNSVTDGASSCRMNRGSSMQPSAPTLTGIMFLQLQEFPLSG
jgi:hypothetical protein